MVATKKTTAEKIVTYLGRYVKPKTATQIAAGTKSNLSSVYSTLQNLENDGTIYADGVVHTGSVGRPAKLYRLSY